ncbi:hypothetical protein MHJ95_02630 [Corynebacterium imitans]|uniref:hypothetical protein n=1 Tax=Corynebacterium imitans TaxID=156978 RepID=UPI001EF39825|nr:hypothetical protein [Corynebacterium imitans]MCG7277893.1 hypothetical protein [Corynebacterium imitans]
MSRIEREAVDVFRALFDSTRMLEPALETGEKGTITDGYVDIYKSEYNQQTDHGLREGELLGRLPVQIKGKIVGSNRKLSSFSLSRRALIAIKTIGGLVLLVAAIDKDDHKPRATYYADLMPSDVDYLLSQMSSGQKTKAVPLKGFHNDPEEIYTYIRHSHRRYRSNAVVSPSDELMKATDSISVSLPYEVDWSTPQLIGGPGSSAILEITDKAENKHVIDATLQVTPADYVLHSMDNLRLSCGGVVFDSPRRRRVSEHEAELYVSPGICLTFHAEKKTKVKLHYRRSLYDALRDQKFLVGMLNGEPILANGQEWLHIGATSRRLNKFVKPIQYLEDLNRLCRELKIESRLLNVTDLGEKTLDSLKSLVLCLFHGAGLENEQGNPFRQSIDVNGALIEILWMYNGKESKWVPMSFFDSLEFRCRAYVNDTSEGDRDGLPELVTPYEFFTAEDLARVLNLNLEHAVEAYQRIGTRRARDLVGATVLKLIKAADSTIHRRHEFLSAAQKLSDWVLEDCGKNPQAVINHMQIKSRLDSLAPNDIAVLTQLWNEAGDKGFGEDSLHIETATSILLKKFEGTEYLLSKMRDVDRLAFEEDPLWFLYEYRDVSYIVGTPGDEDEWQAIEDKLERENIEEIVGSCLGKKIEIERH